MPTRSRSSFRSEPKILSAASSISSKTKPSFIRDETLGAEYHSRRSSRRIQEIVHEYREKIIEAASEADEKLFEKFVDGEAITNEELKAAIRKANDSDQADAGPVRFGIQEQRRSAVARCGRGLSAVAARYSAGSGFDSGSDPLLKRETPNDKEPFSALVFKIMTDPFVGQLAFLPRLLRQPEFRFVRFQFDQADARTRRPSSEDACQQARRNQGRLRG